MVLHEILHDFLLLGGDLHAVYPQGGLLVRPPLGLLHGLHVVPLGVQGVVPLLILTLKSLVSLLPAVDSLNSSPLAAFSKLIPTTRDSVNLLPTVDS